MRAGTKISNCLDLENFDNFDDIRSLSIDCAPATLDDHLEFYNRLLQRFEQTKTRKLEFVSLTFRGHNLSDYYADAFIKRLIERVGKLKQPTTVYVNVVNDRRVGTTLFEKQIGVINTGYINRLQIRYRKNIEFDPDIVRKNVYLTNIELVRKNVCASLNTTTALVDKLLRGFRNYDLCDIIENGLQFNCSPEFNIAACLCTDNTAALKLFKSVRVTLVCILKHKNVCKDMIRCLLNYLHPIHWRQDTASAPSKIDLKIERIIYSLRLEKRLDYKRVALVEALLGKRSNKRIKLK